jgi:hypothetical protein
MVIVKSGRSEGTRWALSAIDSGDGRYCVEVAVAGSPRAKKCGTFYVPGPTGAPVRLSWMADSRGPQPTFVAGAVVAAARHVAIRLSDGSARTVATIPAADAPARAGDRLLPRDEALRRVPDRDYRPRRCRPRCRELETHAERATGACASLLIFGHSCTYLRRRNGVKRPPSGDAGLCAGVIGFISAWDALPEGSSESGDRMEPADRSCDLVGLDSNGR